MSDSEELKSSYENHFTWDIDKLIPWENAAEFLEDKIRQYNTFVPFRRTLARFRYCLLMAYVMSKENLGGWLNCVQNALLILEYPSLDTPLMKLPPLDSPLWEDSLGNFLKYVPESENNPEGGSNATDIDHDDDEEEGCMEGGFEGLRVAAEHVAYSLRDAILIRVKGYFFLPGEARADIFRLERLEDPDKAGIYFFKAATIRECGYHALPRAINVMRKAVLTNPKDLQWSLKVMQYEGYKRRADRYTHVPDLASLETTLATADSVLRTDPDPKMAMKFRYEQFQAIKDFILSHQSCPTYSSHREQNRRLRDKCTALVEEIVSQTDNPKRLANCAQYLAHDRQHIYRAVEMIERSLEQQPLDTYINGKASNIYRKANKLEKALKCAEVAAEISVGSYLQILNLKIKLGHPFDLREFFDRGLAKYFRISDQRLLYITGFIYLTCFTLHFKQAVEYFKLFLDSEPPEYNPRQYIKNKTIYAGEAAYNLVSYILTGDTTFKDDEVNIKDDKYLFKEVQKRIEEKCDVREFDRRVTPQMYLRWMREDNVSYTVHAFDEPLSWRQRH